MKSFLPVAVIMALAAPVASAQLTSVPMLTRTVCADRNCDDVERYGNLVAPALSSDVVSGTLMVDGDDPIAPCLERLERDNPEQIGKCIQRKLDSRDAAEALAAKGHDLYMVLVLRNDRRQAVHGMAVFLTPNRKSYVAYTHLSPMTVGPDGMIEYTTLDRAVPGAPVIIMVNGLSEWAAMEGVAALPPHRPVLEFASPRGTGTYSGTAVAMLE